MQFFDELAHQWDSEEHRLRASSLAGDIRKEWRSNPPATVLDFGSGTGLLSLHFIEELSALYAYDPSEGMRQTFEEKLPFLPKTLSEKVTILADLNELPKGFTCDAVLVSQVVHHIQDATGTIADLGSRVNETGSIVVIDFVAGDGFTHPGHHHQDLPHHGFDPQDVATWIYEAGFPQVSVRHVYEGTHISPDGHEQPYRLFMAMGSRTP